MTDTEKLEKLKIRIDPNKMWNADEEHLLSTLLDDAESNIMEWRYSLCQTLPQSMPRCFENVQIQAALIDYNLMGMENETTHKELDVSFTNKYTSGMDYIRDHVMSFVGL